MQPQVYGGGGDQFPPQLARDILWRNESQFWGELRRVGQKNKKEE